MKTDNVEKFMDLYDTNGVWKGIIDVSLVHQMERDGVNIVSGAGSYEQFMRWDNDEKQSVD